MGYKIFPAQPSDIDDIVTVYLAAFKNDPILGYVWCNIPSEANHAYMIRHFGRYFDNAKRDGAWFRKVVDEESGRLVAFAKWQFPHTLTPEQQAEKDEQERNPTPHPEGTNLELLNLFANGLNEKKDKWIDESKAYRESPISLALLSTV